MNRKKTIEIIFSVIGAIALWMYVVNVVNPPISVSYKDIPVQLLNQDYLSDNRLAIAGTGEYTVDVSLNGSRNLIKDVTAEQIVATADLNGLKAGQNYINVEVQAPNELNVEDIRSQKIQIYIDELVSVDKEVLVDYPVLEEGYEIYILSQGAESVKVTGAKSLVDMVDKVLLSVDVNSLQEDKYTTQELDCIPVDAEGNIVPVVTADPLTVGVTSTRFATKTVPLNVQVVGKPGLGAQVSSFSAPKSITIKGPLARLDAVDSIDARNINIEGITSSMTVTVEPQLPSEIWMADSNEQLLATVALADSGRVTYLYTLDDVVIRNLAPGLEATIIRELDEFGNPLPDSGITVVASGPLDVIKSLTSANLTPSLDLSYINVGQLKLELSNIYEGGSVTIETDPTYLDVMVVDPNAPQEPEVTDPENPEGEGEGGENQTEPEPTEGE